MKHIRYITHDPVVHTIFNERILSCLSRRLALWKEAPDTIELFRTRINHPGIRKNKKTNIGVMVKRLLITYKKQCERNA